MSRYTHPVLPLQQALRLHSLRCIHNLCSQPDYTADTQLLLLELLL
jgi:hypothetical protein